LDSAGAYVVAAGPDGETDISHAIGAANANRHDPTFQTYISETPQAAEHVAVRGREGGAQAELGGGVASALTGHRGKDGGGHDGFVLIPGSEEAATLTKGSANDGVSEPGRRREDDENLVIAAGFNHQSIVDVTEDEAAPVQSGKGHGSSAVVEGWAQGHQGQISNFDDEVPAITAGGETVRNNSPMVYEEDVADTAWLELGRCAHVLEGARCCVDGGLGELGGV
jgi:hypothetical protein